MNLNSLLEFFYIDKVINTIEDRIEYAVIDKKSGEVVVDYSPSKISVIDGVRTGKDICFYYVNTYGVTELIQITSLGDDENSQDDFHYVKTKTSIKTKNLTFISCELDEYLYVYGYRDDFEQISLYSLKERRLITPFVDSIKLWDNSKAFAQITTDITTIDDMGRLKNVTTLISFINELGEFIAPTIDSEGLFYYDYYELLNNGSGFKKYYEFVEIVMEENNDREMEHEYLLSRMMDEVLGGSCQVTNTKPDVPCKIIQFNQGGGSKK